MGGRFEVKAWNLNGLDGWGVYDTHFLRYVGGWFGQSVRGAAEMMALFYEQESSRQ